MLFRNRKADNRLIGIWISDKELTTKDWVYPKPVVEEKMKIIEGIFGKLRFEFTKNEMYSTYEEIKDKYKYHVVDSDENSVVIRVTDIDNGVPPV